MDFYKFWQILDGKLNEWDPNEPDEGPDNERPSAVGEGELERELRFKNGVFVDAQSNKKWPAIMDPKLNSVIGEPGDTYEMFVRISGQMSYTPGDGSMGDPDGRGPEVNEGDSPDIEVEELFITNKRTGEQVDLSRSPEASVNNRSLLFKLYSGGVYNLDWDFHNGKVSVHIQP
jgi:hypothetical protein